ncbi:MAG: nucleotidyltransferase domain-containing protein [Waddliaceae bacterium]
MYGLTDSDLKEIIEVLNQFPQVDSAILFGSRAMERDKKGSDIDLALKGNSLESITFQIAGKLNEESSLPYTFDILNYDSIANVDLQNHIDRVGKTIYKRSKNH